MGARREAAREDDACAYVTILCDRKCLAYARNRSFFDVAFALRTAGLAARSVSVGLAQAP